jgi:hypothetical protein
MGPQSPEQASMDGAEARLNVLGGRTLGGSTLGEMGSFPVLHPLLTAAVAGHPHFDGEDVHWAAFEREWEEHVKVLKMACGGRDMDVLLLEQLRKSLDKAGQLHLQMRKEANPNLTYESYMRELRFRHGCDVNAQNRSAWESVRFHMRDGEHPTPAELRVFRAEFELKAARVEGKSLAEEHRLVFQQLPRRWQEVITKAEAQRTRGHHWVRVTQVPAQVSKGRLSDLLERATGETIASVQPCDSGFMVECESEAVMRKVLDFNGGVLQGQTIRISRAERKFSATEIFERLTELVGVQASVERTRDVYGCPRAGVAACEAQSPGKESWGSGGSFRTAHSHETPSPSERRVKETVRPTYPRGREAERGGRGGGYQAGKGSSKGADRDRQSYGKSKGGGRSGRGRGSDGRGRGARDECWRCSEEGRDHYHNWWECRTRRRLEAEADKANSTTGGKTKEGSARDGATSSVQKPQH